MEKSLEIEPDAREARLRLVEMLHNLPWLLGGSKSRAEEHARLLESQDPIYGARARSLLLPPKDAVARLALWQEVVSQREDSAWAHLELAKACKGAGDGAGGGGAFLRPGLASPVRWF
jgi:hypothetical protein